MARQRAVIDALVEARTAAGLKKRELSRMLKREEHFIHLVEKGERMLSICEFFDVVETIGADPVDVTEKILKGGRAK